MILRCKFCNKNFSSKYKKQIFCSIQCSNRKNLNNKKTVTLPTTHTIELAEFFGILLGDGSVTKYYTRVYLNLIADKGYEKVVIHLIKKLFSNTKICLMERPKRGTREIQISSIEVCNYFKKIGFIPEVRSIPSWIIENPLFIKATIRGLFDTEGSIGFKKFVGKNGTYIYKQLTFTNKNKPLLDFMQNSLENLNYTPTKNSSRNIYISNKKDIERYFKEIGTSNPKLEKKMKMR